MFDAIKTFFANREMKKIRKFWKDQMNEKYTLEYQEFLNAQFKRDAQKILEEVIKPYCDKAETIHRGIRNIEISISIWGNEDYTIWSNVEPYGEEHDYPTPTWDYYGVWLAAIDLCPAYGLEGMCRDDDEGFGFNFYFYKKVA